MSYFKAVERLYKRFYYSVYSPKTKEEADKHLWRACRYGQLDKINQSIAMGARINAVHPTMGDTPLLFAIKMGNTSAALLLLKKGACPFKTDTGGMSPLMYAFYYDQPDVAKELLKHEQDMNASTRDGLRVIHLAASRASARLLSLVLDKGSDVHAQDINGMTPLVYAARRARYDNVKLLLERGADMNQLLMHT